MVLNPQILLKNSLIEVVLLIIEGFFKRVERVVRPLLQHGCQVAAVEALVIGCPPSFSSQAVDRQGVFGMSGGRSRMRRRRF